jgi:hypothetical protein
LLVKVSKVLCNLQALEGCQKFTNAIIIGGQGSVDGFVCSTTAASPNEQCANRGE